MTAQSQLLKTNSRADASGGMAFTLVLTAVAMMPFLSPKGPGNSAPVDMMMALAVGAVVLWAGVSGSTLHLPYAVPMAGLLTVGATAALFSPAPKLGGIAVMQEIFLLAFCGAVTSLCRSPGVLRAVLRTWSIAATAWASALVLAVLAGMPALAGVSRAGGGRARQMFDHPNMAGNYFMISVFVVVASRYPSSGRLRAGSVAVLVTAMVLSGSNAASLSLMLGGLAALFLHLHWKVSTAAAATVVAVLVLVGGGTWAVVSGPALTIVQHSENPYIKYSVGRASRSAEARQSLFSEQYELFEKGGLIGLGPAGTRRTLEQEPASAAKESHNDYLATLVERGPFGAVALLALIASIAIRLASIGPHRLLPAFRDAVPNPAALIGAFVAFAFTAITHEVLHYRHLWTLLGVVAALHLFGRRADPAPDTEASRAG